MNTARFCQFHDVWENKWSFCSEEKETGTTISSRILYWVPLPYEIDTGTLCLLQILQTRLFHSARWSGWNHLLVTLRLVCSTIMVKFYEKLWLLKKITNYWHLKFLLLIAPTRGWHLCNVFSRNLHSTCWIKNNLNIVLSLQRKMASWDQLYWK